MAGEEGEGKVGVGGGGNGKETFQIETAIRSRLQHFRDQADSLTLESVRRLLEKDLGLDKFALDAHKRFIRQFLEKQMDAADNLNSKTVAESVDKDVDLNKEEATVSPIQSDAERGSIISKTEEKEMVEVSPVKEVLTPKSEADRQDSPVSKSSIEKAILERADHFLANSENITLAGVRRLLEEDLGLEKNTLDPYKKFISLQIDQVLNPPKGAKSAKDKKKISTKPQSKKSKNIISEEERSDHSGGESEMEDEEEDVPRRKSKKLDELKKRKRSKDLDISTKKQKKLPKKKKEEDSDSDDHGSASENGRSQSPAEKSAQKKEKSATGYGKQVEHLKSIIKACGMSVAPTIYKKAKQVPDNKREAFLVKELEAILSREGLSKNPTEKEIRDCKKRKETARELEGIDMSNIISSSRRRSTFSFLAPPKREPRAKGDSVVAEVEKNKDKTHKDKSDEKEEEKEKEKKPDKDEKEEEEEQEEEQEEEEEDDEDDEEEEDDESEEFNEDDNEESD